MKNQKGFTLVELMVVVALLPIIFFAMYGSLTMAQVVFQTNNVYSELNKSAIQTLRYISREIGQASPNATPSHLTITTTDDNSDVRFQIPVDYDNDGDAVTADANPDVEWGAYDEANSKSDGRLDAWVRYYVDENQLIREVLGAGGGAVEGTNQVIANNVEDFTVTQSTNTLTMAVTLQGTDDTGQSGQARTFQSTMTSQTLLRNAVS